MEIVRTNPYLVIILSNPSCCATSGRSISMQLVGPCLYGDGVVPAL